MSLLLNSKYTQHAFLELTSRCNLRCVYCAVSQPSYHGQDFNLSHFDALIRDLKERGIRVLNVNGHGETTMIKDWHLLCERLMSEDIKLVIITNLSRRLADAEVETLARFDSITASCDTVDSDLFTKMRRSAKLETFFENIERIQAASGRINHEPCWAWSAVVTDLSVFGVKELAREGLKRKIYNFSFVGLTKYKPLAEGICVRSIEELTPEQFVIAQQCMNESENMIVKAGGRADIQAGLRSLLSQKEKVKTQMAPPDSLKVEKKTRDCLLPWSEIFLRANGDVAPCCWYPAVGKISDKMSLKSIFENGHLRHLRGAIISSNLDAACQTCPSAGWIPVKKMRRKVALHLFFKALAYQGNRFFRSGYLRRIKIFLARIYYGLVLKNLKRSRERCASGPQN